MASCYRCIRTSKRFSLLTNHFEKEGEKDMPVQLTGERVLGFAKCQMEIPVEGVACFVETVGVFLADGGLWVHPECIARKDGTQVPTRRAFFPLINYEEIAPGGDVQFHMVDQNGFGVKVFSAGVKVFDPSKVELPAANI